jgi:hypothetical protein
MILNKITILNPQLFWMEIINMIRRGISMDNNNGFTETNPISINTDDLIYNLSRFGYREFGTRIIEGKSFSIEYIITSILMRGEARRVEAIPTIIKNNMSRINIELLRFLCEKYNVSTKLSNTFDTNVGKSNLSVKYKAERELDLRSKSS